MKPEIKTTHTQTMAKGSLMSAACASVAIREWTDFAAPREDDFMFRVT
ncbi:hypothetical protein H2P46_11885 [Mixta sp. Marseille-Q2057]|nr:hypothetical protein [Mixta mediterraneensis]MBE5252793.1 hypothetical protein [Mixta mediterraneensis]